MAEKKIYKIQLKAKYDGRRTYGLSGISESRREVFGCFCIVSSWPSSKGNWICCGDGTGIRLASLLAFGLNIRPPYISETPPYISKSRINC